MRLEIQFSKQFDKQLKNADSEVIKAFRESLGLLMSNKYHPSLNNHLLAGRFIGYRSINVFGDWRAIYREMYGEQGMVLSFEVLGKQGELFR